MHANRRAALVIAGLVTAMVIGIGWQYHRTEQLRGEIREQQAARARVLAHRQAAQQEASRAAAQAQAEELDRVLAERAAVAQLRQQLSALQRRAEGPTVNRSTPGQETTPPALTGNVVACSLWRNAGRTTPEASLETALWASANGDIDTLAQLLVLDPDALAEAQALFAQLPGQLRQEFVAPERLVAVLAAKDVPLGSATILNQYPSPAETKMSVQIFDAEGRQKVALLSLRPDDAGWRFVVPVNAVKRYAAWLHAPPGAGK